MRWAGQHERAFVGVATLLAALLFISHLPSAVIHPQLYADDGTWYGEAHNLGTWAALLRPVGAYLVAYPRLIADLATLLPLEYLPLIFNLAGLAIGVLGIAYLLSSRMEACIPSMSVRALVAALAVAVPNAYDTSLNLTNAQWHLALLAFLVLWAGRPANVWSWALDALILLLACLTGPYCLLLLVVVAYRIWLTPRAVEVRLRAGLVAVCTGIQGFFILANLGGQRPSGELAASLPALLRIVAHQVTLGLLVGTHGLAYLLTTGVGQSLALCALLAILPLAVCGMAVLRGPRILRAFCVFAFGELVLALVAPSIPAPRWPSLALPADLNHFHPGGIRYFLFPMLAFAISLGWVFCRTITRPSMAQRTLAVAAGCLIACMLLVAMPLDWVYPPYIDYHWRQYVVVYEAAAPGTPVRIPINPRGWSMTLSKY